MERNYFKDILFDLLNKWEQDVLEIISDDKKDLFWAVMGDGSVFRLHCEKEAFHLLKPPIEN